MKVPNVIHHFSEPYPLLPLCPKAVRLGRSPFSLARSKPRQRPAKQQHSAIVCGPTFHSTSAAPDSAEPPVPPRLCLRQSRGPREQGLLPADFVLRSPGWPFPGSPPRVHVCRCASLSPAFCDFHPTYKVVPLPRLSTDELYLTPQGSSQSLFLQETSPVAASGWIKHPTYLPQELVAVLSFFRLHC